MTLEYCVYMALGYCVMTLDYCIYSISILRNDIRVLRIITFEYCLTYINDITVINK